MSPDLDLLMQSPDFSVGAILTVHALAPLSLVVQMPGKFYRSQSEPSWEMLYGLLENALGWHLGEKDRTDILKHLAKQHKLTQEVAQSGVGFKSILQHHLRFSPGLKQSPQTLVRYNDYWSQQLRTEGREFVGGSREYDSRAIPVMNAAAKQKDDPSKVKFDDKTAARKGENLVVDFSPGDTLHFNVLRRYFPRYYIKPTQREYVVPETALQYRIKTSAPLAEIIAKALRDPVAPLYLGSSDGWVDVTWHTIQDLQP